MQQQKKTKYFRIIYVCLCVFSFLGIDGWPLTDEIFSAIHLEVVDEMGTGKILSSHTRSLSFCSSFVFNQLIIAKFPSKQGQFWWNILNYWILIYSKIKFETKNSIFALKFRERKPKKNRSKNYGDDEKEEEEEVYLQNVGAI